MNQQKRLAFLIGVLGVALMLVVVVAAIMNTKKDMNLLTELTSSSDLDLVYKDSYYIEDGKTLNMVLGISGVKGEQESVKGMAIYMSNVPECLSNPKISSSLSSWNAQSGSIANNKITFIAEGTLNSLIEDEDEVVTISFDVDNPTLQSYILKVDVDAVYGQKGTIESNSFNIDTKEIELITETGNDFSLTSVSQVTVASNSEFSIPVGVKGAQNVDSKKVNTLSVKFSGLPDYVTECSASSKVSNWSAYVSNLSNGTIQMTATGSGNPLTADVEDLIDLDCETSTVSSGSKKVTLSGELTTIEKSEKFTLSSEYVTLTPKEVSAEKYYSISGTISGDTKSGVLVTCGSYNDVSDSTGKYTIENVPLGASCTMVANKSGYTFSPETRSLSKVSSNLSGYDFEAKVVKGEKGEKGDDGDDGDDGEDGDDAEVTYVAPKSGPAEDIIIGSAVFLGLIGSIFFIGAKLKWFA